MARSLSICRSVRDKATKAYPAYILSVQYIGGYAVHQGMFSTLGDIMSTVGYTMSTPEAYHDECGRYYDYTGGYHEHTGGLL